MALIVGGKEVPCKTKVIDWREHKMEIKPGKGARKRDTKKTTIDVFVLHWTAGEGSAKGCFDVLTTRELGVEFYIGRDGVIYQFADPVLVDTFDAGSMNPRSIGVEIANYGFRGDPKEVPAAGKDRRIYEGTIRGRKIKMAAYYEPQLEAAYNLVEAICNAVPTIPFVIPGEGDQKLYTGTMNPAQERKWKGVLGHFHISDQKTDPGIDIFDYFHAKGVPFSPVPAK